MKTKRFVAALGDVEDINTWSSTPYFFYTTGKKKGLFDAAFRLNVEKYKWARRWWNLKELASMQGVGGFQYSDIFLSKAESQFPAEYYGSDVITLHQHFPRFERIFNAGGKLYYYIDSPLLSLLESGHYNLNLPESKAQEALEVEKSNYHGSEVIVTMATWVADVLVDRYRIKPAKIRTIMPGANIHVPESFQFRDLPFEKKAGKSFKFGFIGKDWERKGLDIVAKVAEMLVKRGLNVSIDVIGCVPNHLKNNPLIHFHGFINKYTDQDQFLDIVSSCDLGCVFSKDEAFGISTLEFLRLGVPVAGFLDKGLIDTITPDVGLGFAVGSSIKDISDRIEAFINNIDEQRVFRLNAQKRSKYVTWDRCVDEWRAGIFPN